MNVLETLTAASGYLEKHGVESPRLNAEHLLAHVLHLKRLELYLAFDRPLSEEERAPLRELIRERGQGKPLQHLLGTAEFFGRSFISDPRALIPRPETEQLVEIVLKQGDFSSALDVGTGSGVIALTLALERPETRITATDTSTSALALAAENAQRLATENTPTFVEADLIPPGDLRFACIVANLPYIPSREIAPLSREVQHDPTSALDGGADGLDFITRLISAAPAHLSPGGFLALEIGHDQSERVEETLRANNFRDIMVQADYQGAKRFLTALNG